MFIASSIASALCSYNTSFGLLGELACLYPRTIAAHMSFVVSVPFNPDITPLHRAPIVSAVYFEPPVITGGYTGGDSNAAASIPPTQFDGVVDTCGIRTPLTPCKGVVQPLHYMAHNLVFSFCPPCKLINARCSRLVTELGWKLPSKSIPTAFHVFLDGLEPPSQCLNMHQRSYSTLPLSYRNIYCGHRWDSNPRRSACHADILPLNYWPILNPLKSFTRPY